MDAPPEPYGVSGKPIVLFFAAVALIAAVIVVAYKIEESKLPPAHMEFTKSSLDAAAAANATIHPIDPKAAKATSNLDDYLNDARTNGAATLDGRLQVEEFRDFLVRTTGEPGPVVFVDWGGTIERITWTGV
ncbi:MAG: hypothetical protein V4510_05895 [bacterium]